MTAPRSFLILRHGESEWNRQRRWQGWIDIGLTEDGEAQADRRGQLLGEQRVPISAIRTSDLERARHTGERIAPHVGHPSVISDEGFRERHGGAFQGLTRDEIEATHGAELDSWTRGTLDAPPGGETDAQIWARFLPALERADQESPPGTILVVTHGGSLRIVATHAGVAEPSIVANVGGWWFVLRDGILRAGSLLDPLAQTVTNSNATE